MLARRSFGRTPTRWQTNICQSIFKQLEEADCLVEQSMEQLYRCVYCCTAVLSAMCV